MRLVALIEDPHVARRILSHLGIEARAPPKGRSWRPPRHELDFEPDPDAARRD